MDPGVFNQVTNVACLPGIQKYSYCMPDGHWGYGFPIGGIAAFDTETGVISPGGIGFDINCGMRLVTTNLTIKKVEPKLKELVNTFFQTVPSGVGAKGFVKINQSQFKPQPIPMRSSRQHAETAANIMQSAPHIL